MRIGIVPCLEPNAGGVYQYSLTMLDAIFELQKNYNEDSFVIFTDDLASEKLDKFRNAGWDIVPLYKTTPLRSLIRNQIKDTVFEDLAVHFLNTLKQRSEKLKPPQDKSSKSIDQPQREWFLSHHVKLMIYPTSNMLSFNTMIPYIFTIHDLQHRIQPEFPEVSADGQQEEREYIISNGVKNALVVLVDSLVGKEDVLKFYKQTGITPSQIKILPFLYASYIKNVSNIETKKIIKLLQLPDEYLFYPAQFWPHKNHLRLIKALGILKSKYNLDIPTVFCGSHTGALRKKTFEEVMSQVGILNLQKNVFYIGYVDDKYISALYKNAKALIMPTFFGPTNIPILEAWSLGCPVITSDLRGIRDQAGSAALLVNPRSEESIALGIKKIWQDQKVRQKLVKLGKYRLSLYKKGDYNKRLRTIIEDAKLKIKRI